MALIRIDRFTVETMGRAWGTQTFVSAMDDGVAEAWEKAQHRLRVFCEENGLEAAEYFMERQVLDEQYTSWVTRLSTYASVVAVHVLTESELFAIADDFAKRTKTDAGRPAQRNLNAAAWYLDEVTNVNVTTQPSWRDMKNVQKLRHLIVHRGGNVTRARDRDDVSRLARHYGEQRIGVASGELRDDHLVVSQNLCREFADKAVELFQWLATREELLPHERRSRT